MRKKPGDGRDGGRRRRVCFAEAGRAGGEDGAGDVGAVGKAKKSSEKRVNLANVQNAIRQFHAVEGRYPKSLNELVKEGYYSKMPAAPRGMRYVYNPKTGQVGVK